MIREVAYDEVFDAQSHFRSLLDSTARPGTIHRLKPVQLDPPAGLNAATALVAFALMDSNTTFAVVNLSHAVSGYLASNTNATLKEIDQASFIFARGDEAPDFLESADCGTLSYPDTAATVILQIGHAGIEPISEALKVSLEGPGVSEAATLFVRGISADLLLALQARNAEFPLGLDTILTFVDESGTPCVAALPRTARVSWEECL